MADADASAEQGYNRRDCPYCSAALDPLPKAKKRCPRCGQPIYVRSGPDGLRSLLRETDLGAHQARWDDYHEAQAQAQAQAIQHNFDAGRWTEAALRSYREL